MRVNGLYSVLFLIIMGLAGCSKETMIDKYADTCSIRLDIDWSFCGIELDGMTAIFYPTDGGQAVRFLTNTVTGDMVRLKKGIYNVVIFNQAATDFSYFTIEGQDQYNTVRVVMKTTQSDWYKPTGEERLINEPEPFATATLEGFEVTETMIQASHNEGKEFPLTCQPERMVFKTQMSFQVKGLHNVRSARGSLKGMADTYWIAKGETGSSVATQLLTFTEKTFNANSVTDGVLSSTFYTFGSPGGTTKATEETENLLTLSILLVDNKTVVTKEYHVAEHLNIDTEKKEAEDTDLMVSDVVSDKTSGSVALLLKHTLSKVNFTVTAPTLAENSTISGSTIKLTGLKNAATLSFASPSSWSDVTGKEEFAVTESTDYYMIPQSLSDLEAEISYTITTTDTAVAGGKVVTEKKVTVKLLTSTIGAWETNKQYNYTIVPTLEQVKITATSDNWGEAATPNVPESK